ncbi:MAG TPA: DNA polymerase III subunit chi [Alphaproteobacteria bacterium]|nr:DNA polymerase III subunit chi [Alphaproteobacteria bacterium]
MTEIRFYHLLRKTLEQALPELLEKCRERGWRAVVVAGSEERVEQMAQHLWTYNERSFLPHGTKRDGEAADQPIWLTDRDENPNGATVLFLTDGATSAQVDAFTLVCDLFDGNDPGALQAARERWKARKDEGHTLAYWQQDDAGRWQEKQRTSPAGK